MTTIANGKNWTRSLARGLIALTLGVALVATGQGQGCPPVDLEAIRGSGSNAKVGFTCGTGCNTAYYLVANAVSNYECVLITTKRKETNCGFYDDYNEFRGTQVSGNNFTVRVTSFDPDTCAMTTSDLTASSKVESVSTYDVVHNSLCDNGVRITGYQAVWIDDVIQPGPATNCGTITWPQSANMNLVSSNLSTGPCGEIRINEVHETVDESYRTVLTEITSTSQGYHSEYTTGLAIIRARMCAMKNLDQLLLANDAGLGGKALCSFSLATDRSSASVEVARWRLRITGTTAQQKYIVTLFWKETINGKTRFYQEERRAIAPDMLTWYYPRPIGELLKPKESSDCGYTSSRELVDASLSQE